jgi:hypothetical protein
LSPEQLKIDRHMVPAGVLDNYAASASTLPK